MFKKLYQFFSRLFKPRSGNPESQDNQKNTPEPEKVFLRFLWIKIDLTNPSWKAVILAVIFLITVVIIIYGLRGPIPQSKDGTPAKKVDSLGLYSR